MRIVDSLEKTDIFNHPKTQGVIAQYRADAAYAREKQKLEQFMTFFKDKSEGLFDGQENTQRYSLIDLSVYKKGGIYPHMMSLYQHLDSDNTQLHTVSRLVGFDKFEDYIASSVIHLLPNGQIIEFTFLDRIFSLTQDPKPMFDAIRDTIRIVSFHQALEASLAHHAPTKIKIKV